MKYLTFKNVLIGYAVLMSLIIGISITVGAIRMGQSSTIVVDASKYIKEELEASKSKVLDYDNQYNILINNLILRNQEIKQLQAIIQDRNTLINQLKIKSNEVPATIDYTNEQHDSLFTDFIQGLN